MVTRFLTIPFAFACTFAWSLAASRVHAQMPVANLPTAALISPEDDVITGLLEAKLLEGDDAKWLERNEIKRLLEEQKLDAMFSAAGRQDRLSLGKLLKADLLLMVRKIDSPERKGKQLLECVVCETKQGLRLRIAHVPVDMDVEQATQTLAAAFTAGLRKYQGSIREIVAVSPLVSNDLSFKYNYLQTAYAKLIEQTLLDYPGVVVVELGEAQAIGRELTLSAEQDSIVRHQQPLFVLGTFRHTETKEKTTLSLQLRLLRGEQKLATREVATLSPDEAGAWLRASADVLFREVKAAPKAKSNPQAEAEQLTRRAEEFLQIGNFAEALPLLEASVLLYPSHQETRQYAVVAVTKLLPKYRVHSPECTDEQAQRYIDLCLRGVEHLEAFMQKAGPLERFQRPGKNSFIDDFSHACAYSNFHPQSRRSVLDMAMAAARERSAAFLRIERMRANAGYDEDGWSLYAISPLPDQERLELAYQLMEEFAERPNGLRRMSMLGMRLGVDRHGPAHQSFLERMDKSKSALVRQGAENIRKETEIVERSTRELYDKGAKPKPVSEPSDAINLTAVDLSLEKTPFGTAQLSGCLPLSPGTDAIWTDKVLYLMQQKGQLAEAWRINDSKSWILNVVYDGRYLWVTHGHQHQFAALSAIDPKTKRAVEFARADGLPLRDEAERSMQEPGQSGESILVTPLSPGRVMIAGYNGRSWLAIATLDDNEKSARVFHEAREASNQDDKSQIGKTTIAFKPTYMFTLQGDGSTPKVLVGRGMSNLTAADRPLIVDVKTEAISIANFYLPAHYGPEYASEIDGGLVLPILYMGSHGPNLYRIMPSDMHAEPIFVDPPDGRYLELDGKLHIVGKKWFVLDPATKSLEVALNPVPWFCAERWVRGFQVTSIERKQPDDYELRGIYASQHYGILVKTLANSTGNPRDLKVRLWEATLSPERLVATPPLEANSPRLNAPDGPQFEQVHPQLNWGEFHSFPKGNIPAGPGVDVGWNGKTLYIMKQKGILTKVWEGERPSQQITSAVYDGKYVWGAVFRSLQSPLLLVLDPKSNQVYEFNAADGLPDSGPRAPTAPFGRMKLVPVEPGKICVAGYCDTTWLAWATFDGHKKSLKIFHQAREAAKPDIAAQAESTEIIFDPAYGHIARSARGDKIIFGRLAPGAVAEVPLIVDVNTAKVFTAKFRWLAGRDEDQFNRVGAMTAVGDDLYFVRYNPAATAHELLRLSAPEMQPQAVLKNPPDGIYVARGAELHIFGKQWQVFDTRLKQVRVVADDVPWFANHRWLPKGAVHPPFSPPNDTRFDLLDAYASNHYGLLIASGTKNGRRKVESATESK